MKIFSKPFVSLLFSLLLCGTSYALSLKNATDDDFRTEPYAKIYAYFEDYAMRLWEAFDAKKGGLTWFVGSCEGARFYLHSDGTITPVYKESSERYVWRVVNSVPTKSFPKALEDGGVNVNVSFCKTNNDEITLDNYRELTRKDGRFDPNEIRISVAKKPRIKYPHPPKPMAFRDTLKTWGE